jgi:hypothetical protein
LRVLTTGGGPARHFRAYLVAAGEFLFNSVPSGNYTLTISMRDGSGCEATAIGNEGFLGLPVYYGLNFSPYMVVQQIDGRSMRLANNVFLESVRKSPALQKLMNRYSAYTQRFAHQTAACNTLHSIRQRACRWRSRSRP